MERDLKDIIYIDYNERIGVLCDNDKEKVSQIIGTDLTIVTDKQECKCYLLVPLTKKHTFKCHEESLEIDGKVFDSDNFFRKDGCQWAEIPNATALG